MSGAIQEWLRWVQQEFLVEGRTIWPGRKTVFVVVCVGPNGIPADVVEPVPFHSPRRLRVGEIGRDMVFPFSFSPLQGALNETLRHRAP